MSPADGNTRTGGALKKPHRLWSAGRQAETAKALDSVNRSIGTDIRLWPFDVRLSRAWAIALWQAGVLTLEESGAIERGLDAVAQRLEAGEQPIESDEDVHTFIDRLLHREAGDVASKLHTGRSRNDQVATGTRLWSMEACGRLDDAVRALQQVLLGKAIALDEAVMPAYTHLQRAQPVLAAHWILSHFWPLERDRARVAAAGRAAGVLPLGSGAIAGCAFPVSRVLLRGSLGFDSVSQNSIDAVGDRDFVADLVYATAMLGNHLSRLAEDMVVYGSAEFGFVRFGDAFTTGSSMMPQKRNPDAFELARSSGARTLGDLTTLLATLKSVPSGYSKDLQDDKRVLFDAVDTLLLVLPAVEGALEECVFQTERMREAVSAEMMATDLADYLVRKGVSFREAHGVVSKLVAECAASGGADFGELPMDAFQRAHPMFGADVREQLDPRRSVEHRAVEGGTAPNAVRAQIELAKAALAESGIDPEQQRARRPTPRSLNALSGRAPGGAGRSQLAAAGAPSTTGVIGR